MAFCYPKQRRLLKRRYFLRLEQSDLEPFVGTYLVILIQPNELTETRLGITATRRFGKAHQRNRFKRLVREAFRLNYPNLPKGVDIVVKPRRAALGAPFSALESEFLGCCRLPGSGLTFGHLVQLSFFD